MIRLLRIALATALIATAAPATAGVYFQSVAGGGNPNGLSSTRGGVTTIDFNWAPVGGIFQQGSSSSSAAPLGDGSVYVSVGPNSVTSLGSSLPTSDYLALYWGSIDGYNTISFFSGAAEIARFTGDDIWTPANGAQNSADTNRLVEFFFTDGWTFDRVSVASSSSAFEFDNVSFGLLGPKIPEPATWAVLTTALLGLAVMRKRR